MAEFLFECESTLNIEVRQDGVLLEEIQQGITYPIWVKHLDSPVVFTIKSAKATTELSIMLYLVGVE